MADPIRPRPDRLYELLPATIRIGDAERGWPLRALMRLVGAQADLLKEDVDRLWDDFFVETSQRWVVPYLGRLVSNDLLHDVDLSGAAATAQALFPDLRGPNLRPVSSIRTRADVAKTIHYRRRKGTVPALEELARDVSGWAAHVVELFEQLTWNQNANHVRLHSTGTALLRPVDVGDRVHGPWDPASHTVDVRRIAHAEGWYGLRNVGFFLWRLRSYPIRRAAARRVGGAASWRLTFSPLGRSAPLFTAPRPEADETGLATELHVPGPIRASAFHDDLAAAPAGAAHTDFYGDPATAPVSFGVFEDAGAGPVLIPPAQVACANLAHWDTQAQPADARIHVDVARGRLALGSQRAQGRAITVSCSHGFPADLGGGPYERAKWLVRDAPGLRRIPVGAGGLNAAIDDWLLHRDQDTVIELPDDATYPVDRVLPLHATAWLAIEAASGARPHVVPSQGRLRVAAATPGSALTLSGLLVEGALEIAQDVDRVRLLHTTLVPGRTVAEDAGAGAPSGPAVVVSETAAGRQINAGLRVELAFSITGPVRMPAHAEGLWVLDSIVDGRAARGAPRVAAISDAAGTSGPPVTVERSTVLGRSSFRKLLLASESIFTDDVTVERQQEGCVRFSYLTRASTTPRRYRCQPTLEIAAQVERWKAQGGPEPSEAAVGAAVEAWLVPSFTALDYGLPGYCQLRLSAPPQIGEGAADGAEMGAFDHLKQPQRETNLRLRIGEYLPVGLDAGLIFVT